MPKSTEAIGDMYHLSINQKLVSCAVCKRIIFEDQAYQADVDMRLASTLQLIETNCITCHMCKSVSQYSHSGLESTQCPRTSAMPHLLDHDYDRDTDDVPQDADLRCVPKRAVVNGLRLDAAVPILQKLNIIERRFVAKLQTYICGIVLSGGQMAQDGMVIYFPTETLDMMENRLPSVSSERIVCVGSNTKTGTVWRYLRRDVLTAALLWLKHHNALYRDALIEFPLESFFTVPGPQEEIGRFFTNRHH